MSKIRRIGLKRTEVLDELLNNIWVLRPELKRKNTMTILLALQALLREFRAQSQESSHTTVLSVAASSTDAISALKPVEESRERRTVSDDIEW